MTIPVWKICPFNERYEISDHGFVRNFKTKRVLRMYLVDGYFRLTLSCGSKRDKKNYLINRLVLLTFEGRSDDPTKDQAAHINGNRVDNRIENLTWKDHAGNYEDRIKHGTVLNGETHPNAKLTTEKVHLMRNRYANGATQAELAEEFCVVKSHVCNIVNGSRWRT